MKKLKTISVLYKYDEEKKLRQTEKRTVKDKVITLQFTSDYHWADFEPYKLPMQIVYFLYI
jgi:hypothetical protein